MKRLVRHRKLAAIGLALVLAVVLSAAAAAQSWLTLTSVAALSAAVAVAFVELRRTRAALRGLRIRVERTDRRVRKLASSEQSVRRALGQLEKSQANLRSAFNDVATSLYDFHRHTLGPFEVNMPVGQVLAATRLLIKRGDVLDAYALVATNNSLHRLDTNTLRLMRRELKKRGYLRKSLDVARVLTARDGDERDRQARRFIEGEIAVLSGEFTPSVRLESEEFQPRENRILHFVGTALPTKQSGYTLRTHYTALAQQRAGLDPHVATQMGFGHDGDDYRSEDVDGITYHLIPGPARSAEPLNIWMRMNVQRLANLVRVVRPTAIHAASDYLNALAAEVVGKEFGIPAVYESRGFWEETWLSRQAETYRWDDLNQLEATYGLPDVYVWRREIEDRCRRDVTHVVTLDDIMAERVAAGGVPTNRITVVPNAVDVDHFRVLERNDELATELGFDENMTVIGYISSIVEYEGIDTLIDAYASVESSVDGPIGLLIVGDGPVLERLKKQASDLELTNVIFTGRVAHDEVLAYYGVIDIFVVPRRPVDVCHLVTPLKPYEAFSTGRTVVLSDVRALAGIARASNAAELFTAGDSESLAKVLIKLLGDSNRRNQLARDGATWVGANRTWDSNADAYLKLYEQVGAVPLGSFSVPRLAANKVDVATLTQYVTERDMIPFEILSSADEGTEADEIIDHGWKLGSFPRVQLNESIDWPTLCTSDRSWNFRLHSWDFMGPVLRAFDRTGDHRYLMWCVDLALSWATNFNAGQTRGTHAWYDMALGLRGHRLGFLTEHAIRQGIDSEKISLLIKCVVDHQKAFFRDDVFNVRSNHGVYVALGELALARRLGKMPGMGALEVQGRKRIRDMIRRQFAKDGGHLEHSPEYHRMLLVTFRGALAAGLFSTDYEIMRRLERAEDALGWFIQPNGELAQVGDSFARSMWSKRPRTACPTTEFLVSNGHRGEPDDRNLFLLPETGYAIVRSPSTSRATELEKSAYLILSAGFHSRTHKHADDLALSWFDRGSEILIDAGRYGYVDLLPKESSLRGEGYFYGAPERQYVESTRAHNTVEVDGRDHVRRGRRPYGSGLREAEERDGYFRICAEVDHGHWCHRREVLVYPGEWLLVTDELTSRDDRPHEYRVWWNFPESVALRANGANCISIDIDNSPNPLQVSESSGSALIEPVIGARNPMRGWRSRQDLELTPAWSTGFAALRVKDYVFRTLFIFDTSAPAKLPESPF